MLKLKSFNVPIYGAQCLIVFTDLSNDEASEKLAKYNVDWIPNTIKEMDKSAAFYSTNDYGTFMLYYEKDNLTWDVVSHEIFHLTCGILRWYGVKYCDDSEESFSALDGWLTHNIIKLFPQIKFANSTYCQSATPIPLKTFLKLI